jgi:hypothetical protein
LADGDNEYELQDIVNDWGESTIDDVIKRNDVINNSDDDTAIENEVEKLLYAAQKFNSELSLSESPSFKKYEYFNSRERAKKNEADQIPDDVDPSAYKPDTITQVSEEEQIKNLFDLS